jgi:hypothetical protein
MKRISHETIGRARITARVIQSIPGVTLRNFGRPYHKTGENRRIVTIRHSLPPIDFPIFPWELGALARDTAQHLMLKI